jgi:hypothetical protein
MNKLLWTGLFILVRIGQQRSKKPRHGLAKTKYRGLLIDPAQPNKQNFS